MSPEERATLHEMRNEPPLGQLWRYTVEAERTLGTNEARYRFGAAMARCQARDCADPADDAEGAETYTLLGVPFQLRLCADDREHFDKWYRHYRAESQRGK